MCAPGSGWVAFTFGNNKMKKRITNSESEYNIKWWISVLQVCLFAAPFVVFNLIAEDAFDHLGSNYTYLEAIFGCALLFIPLMLIGLIPRVAVVCARDRSRFEQTMQSSVNAAKIVFLALLLSCGCYVWSLFGS